MRKIILSFLLLTVGNCMHSNVRGNNEEVNVSDISNPSGWLLIHTERTTPNILEWNLNIACDSESSESLLLRRSPMRWLISTSNQIRHDCSSSEYIDIMSKSIKVTGKSESKPEVIFYDGCSYLIPMFPKMASCRFIFKSYYNTKGIFSKGEREFVIFNPDTWNQNSIIEFYIKTPVNPDDLPVRYKIYYAGKRNFNESEFKSQEKRSAE